jgi:hypothetical protein
MHATNLITEIIDNPRLGPTIMNWSRIDVSRSNVTLLNSDRPIDKPLGLSDARGYIAFPIGPKILFLASNDSTLADRISREKNRTKLAKSMNKVVVSQAQEFVWGMNDSQLAFVQRHLGTIPEREIVTAKQHQEAIEAARGRS